MSTGGWLLMSLGALFAGETLLHPWLAVPLVLATLLLLRRRLTAPERLAFLVVTGLQVYRAEQAMTDYAAARHSALNELGATSRCFGAGRIVASPTWRNAAFVLVVESDRLECDGLPRGRHRVRLVGGSDELARGDQIEYVAQLGPIATLEQLELPSPWPRAISRQVTLSGGALSVERTRRGAGVGASIDRFRSQVRRRILATYAPRAAGLGRALVLGENDLEPAEQLAFQKSGLSHLLAVSGTHLVFAIVFLVGALRAVLLRITMLSCRLDVRTLTAWFGAVAAPLYADFAGGSGSAWRAACMLTAVYLATALGRRLSGLHALAYSLLAGAVVDPWLGYDVSFLLSAAATAGLVTIGSRMTRSIEDIGTKVLRVVLAPLATTVSAMLPCVPILLVMSPDITVIGILANVVAGPIGEMMALPLCLLHTIAWPLPSLERGLSLAGSGALLTVGAIAEWSASLEFARIAFPPPTSEQFVCLGATALVWVVLRWSTLRIRLMMLALGLACLLGLEAVARRAHAPRGELRVTAVDVGQGDSLLVDLPDGKLMLVDGGGSVTGGVDPGRFILAPLLRARRRSKIDIVVLTHSHPDHYGGLVTLLPELRVGEFWVARAPRPKEAIYELCSGLVRRGTVLRQLAELCLAPRQFGAARVEVLGPCPQLDESRTDNDQSLVIRLSMGRRAALLSGDAEHLAEAELVQRHGAALRSDLLKVGHHGSRSSTSELWLSTIRPTVAWVSVGCRNRFGHPHATTLERLAAAPLAVYRTDQSGSLQWRTDGNAVTLTTARPRLAYGELGKLR